MQDTSTKLMKSTPECVILDKIKIALSLDIDVGALLEAAQKG